MALSANTPRNFAAGPKHYDNRVIKTAKKIYEGAIITQIKATTGNPAEPATNDAAANVFLGIAIEECLTGDGTRTVQVISEGVVELPIEATLTKSKIGTLVYAKDDASVTDATTLGPSIGRLDSFSTTAGYAWIALRQPALTANT